MSLTAARTNSKTAVKDAILAAAADLFHSQGFAATSMQAIAEAVGLSRPALYHHFESKQDIVSALVEEVTVRITQEAARIAESASDSDPMEVFRDLVRAHALWILHRPQHFSVLQYEEKHLPDALHRVQHGSKRQLLDQLRVVLERGVKLGRFKNLDPMITALCIFGMCNSTAEWFKSGGRFGAEAVADMLVDYAVGMVRRPVGDVAVERDDALAWLSVLSDDLSHLRRVLTETETPRRPSGAPRRSSRTAKPSPAPA